MLFKRNRRNAESTTETTVVKPAPAAGNIQVGMKVSDERIFLVDIMIFEAACL